MDFGAGITSLATGTSAIDYLNGGNALVPTMASNFTNTPGGFSSVASSQTYPTSTNQTSKLTFVPTSAAGYLAFNRPGGGQLYPRGNQIPARVP